MPDDIKILALTNVNTLSDTAVFPMVQDLNGTDTTLKASMSQVAGKVAEGTTFVNLTTTAKDLVGAINEAASTGGSVDITTEITTPASVQTFNDGGDNIPLKSCLCNIPIDAEGISSVTVSLAGKNLCPILSSQTVNGVQMVAGSDGTLTFNRVSASTTVADFEIPILLPSGEYIISANNNMAFSGEVLSNTFFRPYDANGTSISAVPFNAVNKTYTFTNSVSKIVIRIARQFSETDFTVKMQLEQGDTSTTYQTYKGHNTTISLGETLTQGGTLEAVSGLLTRTDTTTSQLTGANIPTLSGTNNIYTDCGDIQSLEYFNENGDDIASLVNLMSKNYREVLLPKRVTASVSTITSSSHDGNYNDWGAFNGRTPSNLRNPDANTCWSAAQNETNAWIKVDLGSAKDLYEVQLDIFSNYSGDWVGNIAIQGSNDNTNWTSILANGNANIGIVAPLQQISSTIIQVSGSYRYVRIVGIDKFTVYYNPSCFFDEIFIYAKE